jgi:5-methylcytosine-specific restriction endonuclease McrA
MAKPTFLPRKPKSFDPLKRIQGNPCRKGHTGLRTLMKNGKPGHCVQCQKIRNDEKYAIKKAAKPVKHYEPQELIGPVRPFNEITMFIGKQCKRGHNGQRYRRNGACLQCESDNASRWNVDKKDYKREKNKARRLDNHEETLEKERLNRLERKDDIKVAKQRNRAKRRNAEGDFTVIEICSLKTIQEDLCAYCYTPILKRHDDHYLPIDRGGSNYIENMRIACQPCNNRKHAKDPAIWEAEIGWLPRYTVPTLEMYEVSKHLLTRPLNPFIQCDDPLEEAA